MTDSQVLKIDLDDLRAGTPGISESIGAYLNEAARVCFGFFDHNSDVAMKLESELANSCRVVWSTGVDDVALRAWDDMSIATEEAACGVAVLLLPLLTDFTVVRRARKKTGIDYWLGTKDDPANLFKNAARMEVSGILKSDNRSFRRRVNEKKVQTSQSDLSGLPVIVAVVEFETPRGFFGFK